MILSLMTHLWGYLLTFGAWLLVCGLPAAAQLPQIGGRSVNGVKPGKPTTNPSHEDWYRIEFNGQVVGHESLTYTTASSSGPNKVVGEKLVRRIRDTRLRLKRFGADLSVSAHLETLESLDGVLHSWALKRTSGDGSVIERTGQWNKDKSGFEMTEKISSGAAQRELLVSPVQPRSPIFPPWLSVASGQSNRLWTTAAFFPETAAIVDVEIRQAANQSLQLANGQTIAVSRFEYWPTSSPDMKTVVFYNDQQTVVRIEQPLAGQVLRLERTDAAGALGQESLAALDLQFSSVMPLKRPLPNLETSESLRLKISVGASEQISLPSGDFQTVEQKSGNELLVTLVRPGKTPATDRESLPVSGKPQIDPEFTSTTRWLTSANEDVKRMGIFVAGSTSVPHDKCERLTRHVWKNLRSSSFSTSLRPAAEIVRDMRGDCTEHAVLLSALMRSQGIPSRVVVGFVYVPNPASYAPHMWTEALLDGKWTPFDSTRGPNGIGLTHLKVSDSTLSDEIGSGTVLFIPLLSFLGRATVDVASQ